MPKKKTALTIEERLQQALVPAEEQPYEVPENWVWVRLGSLYEVNPKNKAADELDAAFIPMEKISAGMLSEYSYETQEWCKAKKGHTQFADGDVAFAKISPCFENRKSMMLNNLPNSIGGGTTELIILRNASINQKYTFWLVSDERFIRGGVQTYSGTVGQQRINMDYVRSYPVPLPPLSEQQRIVERIEELFAKLDEAKERLQEVADSFAVRKAAILHKAFTGELIGKQVTELVPLENLVDLIKIGPFGSSLHESDYIENGIPLVNPKHIVQQRIVPQSKISISDEKAEELSSYKLKENDIVLGRRGEMGRCAPISNREENWICGTGSMIIRLKKEYDAKLYSLILGSQATVTYLENSAVGSTLKNLNEKIVRKIPVPQFSSEEQHEIVRLIDDLLARERAAQQAVEQALASIDLMKKSILARAFRGELGTNKASEASALELLKQVLAED